MSNGETALSKSTTVAFSTSSYSGFDEADYITDGLRTTFWATSGLYPQQFIISFSKNSSISSVEIRSYFVKLISLERSISEEPEAFLFVGEKELELTDNQHQRESLHDGTMEARHLKFTIKSGYDHICAVYKIEIKNDENTVYSAASVTEYDAPSRDERSFSVPSKILEDQSASLTRADVAPPLQGHTPFMRSNVGKVVSKLSPPQEELQLQSNMKSQSGKFMDLKEITSSDEEF